MINQMEDIINLRKGEDMIHHVIHYNGDDGPGCIGMIIGASIFWGIIFWLFGC